jgi:hypothetical protein
MGLTDKRGLLFTIAEAKMSKVMVLAWLVCDESLVFIKNPFLVCPHTVEGTGSLLWTSFIKALISFMIIIIYQMSHLRILSPQG